MTDYTKDFQKFFESQLGRVNSWTAWQAIMSGIAYALANAVDPDKKRVAKREEMYKTCVDTLGSEDVLAQAHMKYVI